MVNRKRSLELGLLILGLLLIIGGLNFKSVIGFVWHLTHSSKLQYGNAQIHVPRGWFPWERAEYLTLYSYPSVKSSPTILFDRDVIDLTRRGPKERVEQAGRVYDGTETIFVGGKEGVRITSHSLEGAKPYLVLVVVPAHSLTITYQGTKDDISVFDSFLNGVTFITR